MKKAIILSMMLTLVLTGCGVKGTPAAKILPPEEAKTKITEFINKTLLAGAGYEATVESIVEENGLYKVAISVNNQEIDAYLTRDVSLFFPQAIKVVDSEADVASPETAQAPSVQEVNNKTAKPTVELFVMSSCPYGTQIEKGILPVIDTLSKKIDFQLKFCDYAMHGQPELNEQLNQYCIQKNEPQNLVAYLKCYLGGKTGDAAESAACVKSVKINASKLKTCVASTDKTYKVSSLYDDKSTWVSGQFPQFNVFKEDVTKYGVQGSPTLVINGEVISSSRDSASLLKTICSGFDVQPEECQAALSSEQPSAGFGYNTATADSAAASCATPAQ